MLGIPNIGLDDNVFELGIDSFGMGIIQSRLRAALRVAGLPEERLSNVNTKLLFGAGTVTKLAQSISSFLGGSAFPESDSPSAQDVLRLAPRI